MLVIRLQRTGRRNIPAYRLAVAPKHAAVKGKVREYVGYYLPARNPHVFEFRKERIEYWISRGAQPSDTAARLLRRAGVTGLEKFIRTYTKRKKKGAEAGLPAPSTPLGVNSDEAKAGKDADAAKQEASDQGGGEIPAPTDSAQAQASQKKVEEEQKEG